MSFPTVIYGAEGDQFKLYAGTRRTAQRHPFGAQMILEDGRKYRWAKAGGSDLVVGNVIQAAANVANHVDTTAAANAIDALTLTTTLGATAATIDQYFEGYANISVDPGAGRLYKFGTTPVVASSGSFVGTLYVPFKILVALTTTSRVDLLKNPYDNVIQAPATTLTGAIVGVAVAIILTSETGNNWGWLQTRGMASILTAGTLILGNNATMPTGIGGAVGPAAATPIEAVIGVVQRVRLIPLGAPCG